MKNLLKILFITPSYKPAYVYGGPTVSVSELAEELVRQGACVTVYTTTANGKHELEVPVASVVDLNGVQVYYFNRLTGDHTHISPALWLKLNSTIRQFDVVHVQSWWSLLVLGVATICRLRGKHFVLSPRGMLSQYSFTTLHTTSKKWIHKLIGSRLLRKSFLHATTELERRDCQYVNPEWKGFVLPNLVLFPKDMSIKQAKQSNNPIVFGFLSRIDPKKGIENLFQALSKVNFQFQLRIAGKGEESYVDRLKAMAASLGISDHIEWCGWQNGKEKFAFLQSLDVFLLVSHNENFANVVIESLATGTAVLVSDRVGLADYVLQRNLGWVTTQNVNELANTLTTVNNERIELSRIRQISPDLVRKDYNHAELARAYLNEYCKIYGLDYTLINKNSSTTTPLSKTHSFYNYG